MPRKPRVDPPPLEHFEIEVNGEKIECEIRDETCVIKSAGYINRELYSVRLWDSIMPRVAADYLDVNGRKSVPSSKDYLSSPTKFANQMTRLGLNPSGDLTSLRKDYYPDVLKQVQVFESAIKAKKQS
jgi:hypothetical protein